MPITNDPVQDWHDQHEVTYKLSVIIDGEEKFKATSTVDAHDVATYSEIIQEQVDQLMHEDNQSINESEDGDEN